MSDNSLIPAGQSLPIQAYDDKDVDRLASSGWMPRIQLMDKGSAPVGDQLINQGRWAFIRNKKSLDDLTNSFEGLCLARRPKALRIDRSGILSVYDPKDPEFGKIETQSEIRDSGCSFGTEYLIWVRANRQYAHLFCNSKTSRNASVDLNNILKKWAAKEIPAPQVKFKCEQVSNNQYKWWAPIFVLETTPFSEMPPFDEVREQIQKFLNPPKNEQETVSEGVEQRG